MQSIEHCIESLRTDPFFQHLTIHACTLLEGQGHCNQNYLLRTGSTDYILRIFGKEPRDRAAEYHIQSLAADKGIAPKVLLLDKAQRCMLSIHHRGVHRTSLDTSSLRALAEILHSLHQIPFDGVPILEPETREITAAFDYDPVLCHNDLNPQNILWEGELPTLIDWEYAGSNDRYFDLAAVSVEFELTTEESTTFLKSYFGDLHMINKAKLLAYQTLYREVCAAWWQERTETKNC